MNDPDHKSEDQILIFTLDELSCALPVSAVIRVIYAVEVRNLPKAPEIISGIINVGGEIIPVANIRKRFGLAQRETDPDDRLVIADTGKRKVAFFADSVSGVKNLVSGQFVNSKDKLPFARYLKGVAKINDELILIYDLESFLNLNEEMILKEALSAKNNEK